MARIEKVTGISVRHPSQSADDLRMRTSYGFQAQLAETVAGHYPIERVDGEPAEDIYVSANVVQDRMTAEIPLLDGEEMAALKDNPHIIKDYIAYMALHGRRPNAPASSR